MYRANWVRVLGTEYRTPFAVVVGRDSSGELEFGEVRAVYADRQEVLFEFSQWLLNCLMLILIRLFCLLNPTHHPISYSRMISLTITLMVCICYVALIMWS